MYVYMGLYGLLISNNPNNPNANKENMKNLPDRLYKIICKYLKYIQKYVIQYIRKWKENTQ